MVVEDHRKGEMTCMWASGYVLDTVPAVSKRYLGILRQNGSAAVLAFSCESLQIEVSKAYGW